MSLRPSILDPLFAPAANLPGVGPKIAPLLDRLVGSQGGPGRVLDLLLHLPQGGVTRELKGSIAEAPIGEPVTLVVTVAEHRPPPPGRKAPYKVIVEDETGDVMLAFFNAPRARMEKLLPLGARRLVSGKLELWDGYRQMVHPDRVLDERSAGDLPAVETVYGLTEGLSSRLVAKFVGGALDRVPALPEWQDPAWLAQNAFPPFRTALDAIHRPADAASVSAEGLPSNPARKRLAYDEMLASQLALALVRSRMRRLPGRVNAGDGRLVQKLAAALPFGLTGAQQRAIADISRDLASEKRMLRLLQGDVGSGKTAVAVMAMASVVEAGRQAALMAPTEILARQHYERIEPLFRAAGLQTVLITGRDKAAERRAGLTLLQSGAADIAVGTHALFQEGVEFRDLGLAVVDEQHRFGVHQRFALGSKGEAVDVLVMTATPIPRTLALTWFGDMDVSVLDEKPPGRKPIDTRLVSTDRFDEVVAAIGRAIAAGDRVYWVCPLVAESEMVDLAAAEDRYADLKGTFRRGGRPRPRPARRPRQGFCHGSLLSRRDQDPGLDHRDRGRGRRAGGDRDGDRARRALRPRAAAPAARPIGAANVPRPASCSTRARSARWPRRGSR
jgi:ATP-dependent DNA helicase RecG